MKKVVLSVLLLFVFRAAFGQTQLIINGGFEQPNVPPYWVVSGTGAAITNGPFPESGVGYLSMGNIAGADQIVYQTITFPTNLIAATFSFDYEILTSDTIAPDDVLSVYIFGTNGAPLAYMGSVSNLSAVANSGYHLAATNLVSYPGETNLSTYAGQTVEVYFEVTTDPGFGYLTSFNIDNVSMLVGTTADIPPNDIFTNSITLSTNSFTVITIATNTFATNQPGDPMIAGNAGGHMLWWNWTAPAIGTVTINTSGSSFTTLLGVYTGSALTNLVSVASNIGGAVKFNTTAGMQYQIAVDGYNGQSGTIALSLKFSLDTTPPKVSITSPASGAKLTNSTVFVQGKASDNVAVALVEFRLENAAGTNDYQAATGTTNWSATVTNLIPGPNTIRVFAIDTSSNASPTVTRTVTYIVVSPLTLTTNGNGTVSGASDGQLLDVGATYTITAKPALGSVFNGWTGDITANNLTLTFMMQSNLNLTANFVSNPFGPVVGTYQGLLYDTNDVSPQSSGFFSATVKSSGAFSAKLQVGAGKYSFTGLFLGRGFASNSIPRKNATPLSVQLQMDLSGGNRILGLISSDTWTAELLADRAAFNSLTNEAPQMGKYTFVILGSADASVQPGGDSFGTAMVDGSGNVTFTGTLGDGTKVSQKTILSAQGEAPFYASLYSGNGLIFGWLTFTNELTSDIDGVVTWIKPAQPGSKLYPGGFTNQAEAVGSIYLFTKNVPVLNFGAGQVSLVNGNSSDFTNQIVFGTNKVVNLSSNKLTLTITTSSGLFSGSATDPVTLRSILFNGAILEKQNFGSGTFLGTNQSGRVFIGR